MRLHPGWVQFLVRWGFQSCLIFTCLECLVASVEALRTGRAAWFLGMPASIFVTGLVRVMGGGALLVFAHPEGLEVRTAGESRYFPWRMIEEVSLITGYQTNSYSRAFRITLVSGSTLTLVLRRDAIDKIDAARPCRDENWHFEV